MKLNRHLLFLPLLAVLYAPGAAQGYLVTTHGPDSCGEVVAGLRAWDAYFNQGNRSVPLEQARSGEVVVAWVLGYLTGRNYERERNDEYHQLGKDLDADSLALWLTNWCTQNPLKKIQHAAEAFVFLTNMVNQVTDPDLLRQLGKEPDVEIGK